MKDRDSPAPWARHYEPQVPHHLRYPEHSLTRFLENAAECWPDHAATIYFGAKMTYSELNELANRFGRGLPRLGFRAGDRVALMLPNCPQMIAGYYGILKARGIVVQINPLLARTEIADQLRDADARILVTLPRYADVYGQLIEEGVIKDVILTRVGEHASIRYRVVIPLVQWWHGEHQGSLRGSHRHRFHDVVRGHPGGNPSSAPRSGDIALIQYTSGTTGSLKGAMLSHANLVANAIQCRAWVHGIRPGPGGDVFLGVLPFFHVYGMTVCMNLAISAACTIVLLPRFIPDQVLTAVCRHRCTIFPGVELMYSAINRLQRRAKGCLKTLRACISGAGPLYKEVQESFEALTGGRVVEGYGLTEASPVTHCVPMYGERRQGTIGVPFPDTDARIVDATTGRRDMPPGRIGELIVRGPQVMRGYWNNPAETRRALRRGWLYTGDLAVMDRDGFFRIVERRKDMIKTRGENVYPRNVEEVLLGHPGVADVVVVGLPDESLGERVKAYIVPRGSPPPESDLIDLCRKRLARFEVPQEFEFRQSLPKNIIGKTLRRILREEERRRKEGLV